MRFSKLLRSLDWPLLIAVGLILVMSFFVLDSATQTASIKYGTDYIMKQALLVALGICAFSVVLLVDYSKVDKYTVFIYAFNILLLAAVLFYGEETKGAQAWLPIGRYRFQPAELVKVLLILGLAKFLVPRVGKLNTYRQMLPVFIYVGIPLGLIMLQPDLGTGLVFISIMFGMLLAAGASPFKLGLLLGGAVGTVVIAIVGHYKWGWWLPLKEYQLMRLVVFVDPMIDPKNWGWNVIQSKIAVGSGGLLGKGWHMGSQTSGNFLPEQWTDFIFSVGAEEFGFIGAAALIVLLFIVLYRGIKIAGQSKDIYGSLIAIGIVSMFAFHIFQNIGMAMGIMPITGIPLPFVSYGGSALLANMIALGLLMNVNIYREVILF